MVDSWDVWDDFRAMAPRPVGDAKVSIGFDPSKGTNGGGPSGCERRHQRFPSSNTPLRVMHNDASSDSGVASGRFIAAGYDGHEFFANVRT
jgi:hypothetical protein